MLYRPGNSRAAEDKGIKVDLVPKQFIAEGILQSFTAMDLKGKKILIPRAAKARDVLPEGLKKLGAVVDVVTAYQTVNSGKKKEELAALINEDKVDVITFTSSSTVTNFVEIMGRDFQIPGASRYRLHRPGNGSRRKKSGIQD